MEFLAIIQARTASSRLPDKVLMQLEDKTVLEHVISRVSQSKLISDIVIATTLKKEDLKIVKICADNNISVYCGSENDVLDRFYQVARIMNAKNIVRITSDCPVIDPQIIDLVINAFIKSNVDYISNSVKPTFPDGLDVEVFNFKSLEKAFFESKLLSEREHVTPYINKNTHIFKVMDFINNKNLSDLRWTLDNQEDYKFLKEIFSKLYKENSNFFMKNILELLEKEPFLKNINSHIKRNEGYKKSLLNDKKINFDFVKRDLND